MKTSLRFSLVAILIGTPLVGCSGPDDLTLHNEYPFAVRVYRSKFVDGACSQKEKRLIGTVGARSTQTLSGVSFGGKRGACIWFESDKAAKLGWLDINSPLVSLKERFNGSVTFETTIGQSPLTASPPGVDPPSPHP